MNTPVVIISLIDSMNQSWTSCILIVIARILYI